ncbi:MAG: lysostaphin resistance A-like protein [Coprococcus sp.]
MQKRITEAHLLLVVTFGLYIGFQWCRQWLPFESTVFQVVAGQLILVLPGACWMKYKKVDFKERFKMHTLSGENVKMALAVLLCTYPAAVLLNILSMMFVKNAMTSVISSMVPLGLFPMLFIMALMPAFNEEFLCRGILYQAYSPASKVGGAVLSAFVFGLLHLNFNQMPYAFYIGIVFALMVEGTGSIYTSMLMHFVLNGLNVVLNFITYSSNPADAEASLEASQQMISEMTASPEVFWKSFLMMVVLLIFFIGMTGIMIWKTFKNNGRSLKSQDIINTELKDERTSVIDVWILFFIGFALILTYLNTKFL